MLAAVFVGGLALGVVGVRVYDRQGPAVPPEEHTNVLHTPESEMALEKLTAELDLTPEQVSKIHMILDASIMSEADLLDQLKWVQAGGRRRILDVLEPEQRVRFDDLVHEVSDK